MSDNNYGYVYLLTNPAMPGIVKIGMTCREELDERLKELYTTGVPLPFECAYACKVKQTKCREIENALHTAFDPDRLNPNREFFRIKPEQVIAIMKLFNVQDATDEVQQELDNDTDENDKAAVRKATSRRPPLNFHEMGMKEGDVLVWHDDENRKAFIVSERKVSFNDEECYLSTLSAQLVGAKHKHVAPCQYWKFNGRSLSEIYDETYPFGE